MKPSFYAILLALLTSTTSVSAEVRYQYVCNAGFTSDGYCVEPMIDRRHLHGFHESNYKTWLEYCQSGNVAREATDLCIDVMSASERCPSVDFRSDPVLRQTCDRIGLQQTCVHKSPPSDLAPLVKRFIATKVNTLGDPPRRKLASGEAGNEGLHPALKGPLIEEATTKTITLIGKKNFNSNCVKSIKSMLDSTGISKDFGLKANFGGAATMIVQGLTGIYGSTRLFSIGACQLALIRRDLGALTWELNDWEKDNLSKCEAIVQPHRVQMSIAIAEWIVNSAASKFSACSAGTTAHNSNLPYCTGN